MGWRDVVGGRVVAGPVHIGCDGRDDEPHPPRRVATAFQDDRPTIIVPRLVADGRPVWTLYLGRREYELRSSHVTPAGAEYPSADVDSDVNDHVFYAERWQPVFDNHDELEAFDGVPGEGHAYVLVGPATDGRVRLRCPSCPLDFRRSSAELWEALTRLDRAGIGQIRLHALARTL